ncbi:MAG: DUF1289 domain-containing protein [Rhizobiales bacterium]|nr:DUF1289 domain-containing protein [Hyphomicrobiales bacterium]
MKSPCTHVCTLDFDTGYCYGCGRDRNEIGLWGKYSDAQRQEIIDILPERMKAIDESI